MTLWLRFCSENEMRNAYIASFVEYGGGGVTNDIKYNCKKISKIPENL